MDGCACSLTMYYIEVVQLWPLQLLIYHRNSSLFGNKPFSKLGAYSLPAAEFAVPRSDASLLSTYGYGRGRVELWSEVQKILITSWQFEFS